MTKQYKLDEETYQSLLHMIKSKDIGDVNLAIEIISHIEYDDDSEKNMQELCTLAIHNQIKHLCIDPFTIYKTSYIEKVISDLTNKMGIFETADIDVNDSVIKIKWQPPSTIKYIDITIRDTEKFKIR
jgi:hypothetical protein